MLYKRVGMSALSYSKSGTIGIKSILTIAALLYLILPNLLFLFGWLRIELALPLSLFLIASLLHICFHLKPCSSASSFSKNDYLRIAAVIVIAAIIVFLMGFQGEFKQHSDYNFRNTIYCALCNEDWPVVNSHSDFFVYYHSFWLVPAWISSLLKHTIPPMFILTLWSYLGISISLLLFFCKLRKLFFLFIIILFFHAGIGHFLPWQDQPNWIFYVPNLFTHLYAYNHAIPTLVCIALVFGSIQRKWVFFPIGLLFSQSPFASIVLGGIALLHICDGRNTLKQAINTAHISVAILCIIIAVYFSFYHEKNDLYTGLFWIKESGMFGIMHRFTFRVLHSLLLMAGVIVPLYFLLTPKYRKLKLFKYAVILSVLLPIIWIGRVHNEFLYKGSLLLGIITSLLYAHQLKESSLKRRLLIIAFFSVTACFSLKNCLPPIQTIAFSHEARQANIRNKWEGTLNHPEDYEYKNFFRESRPQLLILGNDICHYIFK